MCLTNERQGGHSVHAAARKGLRALPDRTHPLLTYS